MGFEMVTYLFGGSIVKQRLLITATDTGVGKTQFTAALASWLTIYHPQSGYQLWKPVQTGTVLGAPDADSYRLYQASHRHIPEAELVDYTFPDPLAPWIAAEKQCRPIDFDALMESGLLKSEQSDVFIVEGAGGLLVPLTDRDMLIDLAANMELSCCIVARPGLGTVNHTLLTIKQAQLAGISVLGVVFNGCKDLDAPELQQNKWMIEQFSDVPVIGMLPWHELPTETEEDWRHWRSYWAESVEQHIDTTLLFDDDKK